MNEKRVRFSDNINIFTIPRVEGTRELPQLAQTEKVWCYTNEELKEEIRKRKEFAIRNVEKQLGELERRCKKLIEYILKLGDDDGDCDEYELYHEMMGENFYQQSVLARKLIALF